MSCSEYTLPLATDWDQMCSGIVSALDGVTGFTLYSDAGSGTGRVLLYTMRGTTSLLRFRYASTGYGSAYLMKADGVTQTLNLGQITHAYGSRVPLLQIVQLANLTVFRWGYVGGGNSYGNSVFLGITGSTYKAFSSQYYFHPTAETYILWSNAVSFTPIAKKVTGNKQIIFPWWALADDLTYLDEVPITSLGVYCNLDGFVDGTLVTMGSKQYLNLYGGSSSLWFLVPASD